MQQSDLIIIGAGPGGYETAVKAAHAGLKTVIVEQARLGGTCLNVGCIPTKCFCKNAELLSELTEAELLGIKDLSHGEIDMSKVVERKNEVVSTLVSGIEALLKHPNITRVRGKAKFVNAKTIEVPEAMDAKGEHTETLYTAPNIIIATGSVTKFLPIDGKPVRLGGICKGAGMICPNMGTMLCFLTSDCAITHEMLTNALHEVVPRTFNRVTVDGDTSTNDACIVLSNGLAGNALIDWKDENYEIFRDALLCVYTHLARAIAADGEGATHLLTCTVSGSRSEAAAERLGFADGRQPNISEIAHLCGFREPLYFSKVFRKKYGMSPSQ